MPELIQLQYQGTSSSSFNSKSSCASSQNVRRSFSARSSSSSAIQDHCHQIRRVVSGKSTRRTTWPSSLSFYSLREVGATRMPYSVATWTRSKACPSHKTLCRGQAGMLRQFIDDTRSGRDRVFRGPRAQFEDNEYRAARGRWPSCQLSKDMISRRSAASRWASATLWISRCAEPLQSTLVMGPSESGCSADVCGR